MTGKCATPTMCGSDGQSCAKLGCDFFDAGRALRELVSWPRCNDGTYLKIPRRESHSQAKAGA